MQDISEGDCIKEGVIVIPDKGYRWATKGIEAKLAFKELWDSIYAKKHGSRWEDNLFVLVYEFERIER